MEKRMLFFINVINAKKTIIWQKNLNAQNRT
jgi:hypothetical protein